MADDVRALVDAALIVRGRAYAKYSEFLVGAALLAADGKIYGGCNVENVSYGLTNCAERAAVFSAIAAGQRKFELLAIASAGGVTPCGACRQVLAEFAPELPILLVDVDRPGEIVEVNLRDLLPGAFAFEHDTGKRKKPRISRIKRMKSDKK
jgi:cytidine deaminase